MGTGHRLRQIIASAFGGGGRVVVKSFTSKSPTDLRHGTPESRPVSTFDCVAKKVYESSVDIIKLSLDTGVQRRLV